MGYPREGERLAPAALAEVLNDPLPPGLAGRLPGKTHLSDLDSSCWPLNPGEDAELGRVVIQAVARAIRQPLPASITNKPLPPIPRDWETLKALQLDDRTLNLIVRNRLYLRSQVTVQDVLRYRGAGARVLVDLLTALENFSQFHSQSSVNGVVGIGSSNYASREVQELVESRAAPRFPARLARRMLRSKRIASISVSDPRLGKLVYQLMPGAATLGQAIRGYVSTRVASPQTVSVVRKINCTIRRLKGLSLERELAEIFDSLRGTSGGLKSLARFLGVDGKGGSTLQEAADLSGISRERVRQIVERARRKFSSGVYTPALDRALAFVARAAPAPLDSIESRMRDKGVISSTFNVKGLGRLAEFFGKTSPFAVHEIEGRLWVASAGLVAISAVCSQTVRQVAAKQTIASVHQVLARIRAKGIDQSDDDLKALLYAHPSIQWLDDAKEWFCLKEEYRYRSRLRNALRKILSVTPSIQIGELREGLGRHYRSSTSPPKRVLAKWCEQLPECTVINDVVTAAVPFDWHMTLSDVEKLMVTVLKEHNGVMPREELETQCIHRGMNRSTFYVCLGNSPVLARYGAGVYGIRGADVAPGVVESLQKNIPKQKVVADHGWLRSGLLWIAYRLSRYIIRGGMINVPAALESALSGSFTLTDGTSNWGTLNVSSGQQRGLRPFLDASGAQDGDYLVIDYDLENRTATLQLGSQELLFEHQMPQGA